MTAGKYTPVPVIFLDRDGVINKSAAPHEYVTDFENFVILPGVYEALRMFNESGRKIFIITNQRCIARKIATPEQIDIIHRKMLDDFRQHDCHVDGLYMCPHDISDNCACRKPKTGLFLQAQRDLEKSSGCTVDKGASWMIGDSESDIEAGRNYGVNTFLVDGENDLLRAAKKILEGSI